MSLLIDRPWLSRSVALLGAGMMILVVASALSYAGDGTISGAGDWGPVEGGALVVAAMVVLKALELAGKALSTVMATRGWGSKSNNPGKVEATAAHRALDTLLTDHADHMRQIGEMHEIVTARDDEGRPRLWVSARLEEAIERNTRAQTTTAQAMGELVGELRLQRDGAATSG